MLSLLCALTLVTQALAIVGAQVGAEGITNLFGNSFGLPGTNATYDYIVIGGGTAGNAIAARLALANHSVAVVETGTFYEIVNSNRTQVPGYDFYSALNSVGSNKGQSLTEFSLETEPQVGYNGRKVVYVAGQTFGGSSASNYMGYARATVGTFDKWTKLTGDDFWTWDNVFPAYKKSCRFTPPNYQKIDRKANISYDAGAFDSTGGPLEVSYGNYQGPYGPYFDEAMERVGLPRREGLNSGKLLGYATITAAIDPETATRSSSETSFLQLASRNSNIKIYPQTLAKRIIFDEQKRATGVEVQTNSVTNSFTYHLSAAKEVILSAGVWHSPQLLMVSGIGPAETLQKHGISVVNDLPGVGQNEWDQPWMELSFKVNVTTGTQLQAGNEKVSAELVEQYLTNQTGLLASIGGGQALAFEKFPQLYHQQFSNKTRKFLDTFPDDWPEVNYLSLEYGDNPPDLGPDDNYITLGSALSTTSSRGNITIKSADMADGPIISPNWLLDQGDQEQAIAALQRIREIAFNSTIVQSEYRPGSNVTSREDILGWLKENMSLIYHGASTCKMGPKVDKSTVVDSRSRVHGVEGLRVVDASALPFLPPGFPMATVYMLAEKISESILEAN